MVYYPSPRSIHLVIVRSICSINELINFQILSIIEKLSIIVIAYVTTGISGYRYRLCPISVIDLSLSPRAILVIDPQHCFLLHLWFQKIWNSINWLTLGSRRNHCHMSLHSDVVILRTWEVSCFCKCLVTTRLTTFTL